jgi:DNA polymerase III epsilon subunit-like protein
MERIVYFDLEATGPDPDQDRIVEMTFAADEGILLNTLVNPCRPISSGAIAVHGISDEDVAELAPFGAHAERVQEIIDGAVLCGYNIIRFDSKLLDRELRLAGQPGLLKDDGVIVHPEVDLYGLWMRAQPRTLETALLLFGGVELDGAHRSEADTAALPKVLQGMKEKLLGRPYADVQLLRDLSRPEGMVDRDGKFTVKDGVVCFAIGQQRGQPVTSDPGFLDWMLRKDFSAETKRFAQQFLDEIYAGVPSTDDLPF